MGEAHVCGSRPPWRKTVELLTMKISLATNWIENFRRAYVLHSQLSIDGKLAGQMLGTKLCNHSEWLGYVQHLRLDDTGRGQTWSRAYLHNSMSLCWNVTYRFSIIKNCLCSFTGVTGTPCNSRSCPCPYRWALWSERLRGWKGNVILYLGLTLFVKKNSVRRYLILCTDIITYLNTLHLLILFYSYILLQSQTVSTIIMIISQGF